MNNVCVITIANKDYYIECSRINDLSYINGRLVNISNSTITLVTNYDLDTTYPRITCSSMRACGLRSSSNSDTVLVTQNFTNNNDLFSYVNYGYVIICLLFLILGVKLVWKN